MRRQDLLSPFTFNIVLHIPASPERQKKKLSAVILGKKENCLYSQDKLVFRAGNSKKSKKIRKLLDLISEFNKVPEDKINTYKSTVFLYTGHRQ